MHRLLIALVFITVTSSAYALTDDHDFNCAVAGSWALSWMADDNKEDDVPTRNVRYLFYYYVGKLSGRDEKTNWFSEISKQHAAHSKDENLYPGILAECTTLMKNQLLNHSN